MHQVDELPNLFVLDHPLIQHKLTHMRNVATSTRTFRQLLREIALLMGWEVTRNLPLTDETIRTPLTEMEAPVIAGKKLAIVPILRAGVGMADGLLELVGAPEGTRAFNQQHAAVKVYVASLDALHLHDPVGGAAAGIHAE